MTKMAASACTSGVNELDSLVLKCNLWKFLKVLRAQNPPAYKMVIGAPITAIWIEMWDKKSGEVIATLSVAQFVKELRSLPTKGVAFRVHFRTYQFSQHTIDGQQSSGESVWTATHREHLTVDVFPHLLAYVCYEHLQTKASSFELDREKILHYALARKDVMVLAPMIAEYNELLKIEK